MRPLPRLRYCILVLLAVTAGLALGADGAAVRESGPYAVHYNAMPADRIDPALADRHDLPRTADHCIVTVAVMRRDTGQTVGAMVMGEATDPDGRMYALDLREVRETGEIYYVADVALGSATRLDFTLKVSPGGDRPPETIQFGHVFNAD